MWESGGVDEEVGGGGGVEGTLKGERGWWGGARGVCGHFPSTMVYCRLMK